MGKIAFISESSFIYWAPILIAISGIAAAFIFLSVYIGKGGKFTAALICIPVSAILGIIFSRFIHWYCRPAAYDGFVAAMTDYSRGDYALVGVLLACILTACLLRGVKLIDNLPKMLDAMSIGGGFGICIGRLASLFNSSSRGMILPDDVGFPFAYSLVNPVTGEAEHRLATFMIQSFATAAIVAGLLIYMMVQAIRKKKIRSGDIFILFMCTYFISQIVCDSTRYDALVNGFVSMEQIVGLIVLLTVSVIFSVRLIKATGFRYWYIAFWVGILGMLGLAGYMEYFVQNNGTKAAFAYSMMTGALLILFAILLVMRYLSNRKNGASLVHKFRKQQLK